MGWPAVRARPHRRHRASGGGAVYSWRNGPRARKAGIEGVGAEDARHGRGGGTTAVYAIGGMERCRVGEALAAGAHGVAVVGAILEADDPETAARALCVAVD